MRMKKDVLKMTVLILLMTSLFGCQDRPVEEDIPEADQTENKETDIDDSETEKENIEIEVKYKLFAEAVDEGEIISYGSEDHYRYGPSIIKNEDGSYDAWFSSPGNSGSQWDWIRYRHSEDGVNWDNEQIVLRPTPGSADQCSVCDPGMIYFDGYYYLGYTGTDYYEGQGMNNSVFVARSAYPDGPFEKWNGYGWGGAPQPIIKYEGDPSSWGYGEVSFVIKDDDLFIYYSNYDFDVNQNLLNKADLVEDWPLTMREKGTVLFKDTQDSLEVVYDEYHDTFLAFSIDRRMNADSKLIMYSSPNGKEFVKEDSTKDKIRDYAHNIGVAKSKEGHVNSENDLLIGYAFGEKWGVWDTVFQDIRLHKERVQ